jgi:hypothetical protein
LAGCKKDEAVTLQSIAVTTQPTQMSYTVGETFNPAGMVVTATYSDQTTAPVTVTAAMIDYDFSEADDVTVTITYEGKTAETIVTVVEPAIVSIAVNGLTTKVYDGMARPFMFAALR